MLLKEYTDRVNNNKVTASLHPVGTSGRMVDLQTNDEDRFTRLYKRHFPLVMQLITIHGRTPLPEAEDIAQDIFLILWRRREQLLKIHPTELKYYLFVMVKNRLINEGKRATVMRRFWKQILATPPTCTYPGHHELYDRRAERWLHSAMAALPERPRTAYLLREQHGLKVREIAARMGIVQSGASRYLQLAERDIHAFLDGQIM